MPSRRSNAAVVLEALMVVAVAAGFALAVNQISPRGLNLTRDYFPRLTVSTNKPNAPATAVAVNTNQQHGFRAASNAGAVATNESPELLEAAQRIKDEGFQPMDRDRVQSLLQDPRYQQGLIVIIDARGEGSEYAESHIPGAYPFDPYHEEKDLAVVMTPCQNAELVVVYCHSAECPDAETTATMLRRDAGVPTQKLFVYVGGFDDWTAHHLPLEQGARNSGLAPAEGK